MNTPSYNFDFNRSSPYDISLHLSNVDLMFVPRLSDYVDIPTYSKKLANYAERVEVWCDDKLVGLLAYYKSPDKIFISNVSLELSYQGLGLAKQLFNYLFDTASLCSIQRIELKVNVKNIRATKFYFNLGFRIESELNEELLLIFICNG